jgi:nucleotide-binding universal stress UspA family protein
MNPHNLIREKSMFKHILLPTDGSKFSDKGVKQTIKMAKALGANITAVHVVSNYHLVSQDEGFVMPDVPVLRKRLEEIRLTQIRAILGSVRHAANNAGVRCDTVVAIGDTPYKMIIKQAKKSRCDLIMMVSHGRRGIRSMLLGSETAKVLTHSKIPVLVLR